MITIKDILQKLPGSVIKGNPDQSIRQLVKLSGELKVDELCWCSEKNIEQLNEFSAGTVICSLSVPDTYFKKNCNYILVENPRLAFKKVVELFADTKIEFIIEKTASIHVHSKISKKVKIGHNVVIEEGVEIGEETIIGHNTVILKGTIIGKKVKIGANNTIGGVGFGYEKETDGSYSLIHHIGNVVIEDNVDIGNNTTIDRAVLGSTWIKNNVKIDNLVHIAHGVEIGENSLVIANSMIAGSVKIGKNSWIAPSASVLNKKTIGDNAVVGMGAVVLKDVPSEDIVAGNPAKSLKF
ncbi:MAG: DapH/DapD/GlmU-related protein [Bacteroidia bacterium]